MSALCNIYVRDVRAMFLFQLVLLLRHGGSGSKFLWSVLMSLLNLPGEGTKAITAETLSLTAVL